MVKIEKKEKVKTLREKLSKAKSVVFAEYTGLDANKMNELRKQIRSEGAELNISKNTFMKRALSEEKQNGEVSEELKGQMMTLFAYEDAVSPLKKLVEFAKEYETPSVKVGLFEGSVITAKKIIELSELPSQEELMAAIVGGLKSPLTGIVNVLGGAQRNFVYALSAIAEEKEE